MHRIALRSFHVQSKIHWRAWPTPASRLRQPFESCRRQFHVSSPRHSTIEAPTSAEGIKTALDGFAESSRVNLFDLAELLWPAGQYAVPLTAALVVPHIFRYLIDMRAMRKEILYLLPAKPLQKIHRAVVKHKVVTWVEKSSTVTSKEQLVRQVLNLNHRFDTRIRQKYAVPYSIWGRSYLIPPALHVAWTVSVVTWLGATPRFLPEMANDLISVHGVLHCFGCCLLLLLAYDIFRKSPFWRSFDPLQVARMRPWLRHLYGLHKPVRVEGDIEVMPGWYQWWSKPDNMSEGGSVSRPGYAMLFVVAFCSAWQLCLVQWSYLMVGTVITYLRRSWYKVQAEKLIKALDEEAHDWEPRTPKFSAKQREE